MRKRNIIAAGAAGAVSLIIAFPAFAAETPVRHQATFGTVVRVDGDTFALAEKRPEGDSIVTVSLTDDTTLKQKGVVDPDAQLSEGQQVVVRGTPDDGGLTAASVNIMPNS